MGLFGFNKKEEKVDFEINDNDKFWIDDTFNWLVGSFGLPSKSMELITFTDKFFPNSHKNSELNVGSIIKDLSNILELNSTEITFEIQKDIRDLKNVPHEMEGFPLDSETEKISNGYKIHIANSLPPKRLLSRLVYELVLIKLYEEELRFEAGDDYDSLFVYLAAVYLGFGIILSQNLFDTGYSTDGLWETKWNYSSEIPQEMLAYCFAIYLNVFGHKVLPLKDKLPSDFYNLLEKALEYVESYPSEMFSETELKANDLYFQAVQLIKKHEYESAVLKLNEIISITENDKAVSFISYVFERLGYVKIREGKFAESIQLFQKALELDSNNFIARDNIAYALIKMGEVKEGKKHIDKSISLAVKDMAAIYRNLALYFWAKGNIEEAEENFSLSFEAIVVPIFLLEYDYSKFLLVKGEREKSNEYLRLSIEKGEPESTKNE